MDDPLDELFHQRAYKTLLTVGFYDTMIGRYAVRGDPISVDLIAARERFLTKPSRLALDRLSAELTRWIWRDTPRGGGEDG